MKKFVKIIIITVLSAIVILNLLVVMFLFLPKFIPTKSSPQNLTIVRYGGLGSNNPIVKISNYIDDAHIIDHILNISGGVSSTESQVYKLPTFNEGTLEINLSWGDISKSNFIVFFNDAESLHKNGLLIYLADFDDYYIYFVSGNHIVCYSRNRDSIEWTINSTPPSLKCIARDYSDSGFIVGDSKWRDNKWESTSRNDHSVPP